MLQSVTQLQARDYEPRGFLYPICNWQYKIPFCCRNQKRSILSLELKNVYHIGKIGMVNTSELSFDELQDDTSFAPIGKEAVAWLCTQ